MSFRKIWVFTFIVVLIAALGVAVHADAEEVSPPPITIRFSASPGNLSEEEGIFTGPFGFRIDELPTPIPPRGYHFIGWFTEGVQLEAPVAAVRNTTIMAVFVPFPNPETDRYSVIVYNPYPGDMPVGEATIEAITYGHPVLSLPTPVKEGYIFDGWRWNDQPIIAPHIVQEDMELEAAWVSALAELTPVVSAVPRFIPANNLVAAFNPFPGAFAGDEDGIRFGPSGGIIRDMPVPIRNGYEFYGWRLPGAAIAMEGNLTIRQDVMLTAMWQEADYDDNGAAVVNNRDNPQSSPLSINFTSLGAVTGLGFAAICAYILAKKQAKAANKYQANIARHVREARIVIKNHRE